jgi:creatinine amidohydrolase
MPRFDELTREDLRSIAPDATAVVPLGSTEQHGPHLPVCVDTAVVSHLVDRAAEQANEQVPVVVTPALPFGFAQHHLAFGGTISIDLPVYLDVLTSIGRSLAIDGFRRILFINGHGGNDAPVRAVGDRLVHELGLDVLAGGTSYWTCAADALRELDLQVGPVPGHAGGFETSCLMALRPDLVRTQRLPGIEPELQPLAEIAMPGAAVRRAGTWEASDGRTDDASRADAAIGERALAAVAERLAEFIVQFHRAGR